MYVKYIAYWNIFQNKLEVTKKFQVMGKRFQMIEDTEIINGLDERSNLSYVILEEVFKNEGMKR